MFLIPVTVSAHGGGGGAVVRGILGGGPLGEKQPKKKKRPGLAPGQGNLKKTVSAFQYSVIGPKQRICGSSTALAPKIFGRGLVGRLSNLARRLRLCVGPKDSQLQNNKQRGLMVVHSMHKLVVCGQKIKRLLEVFILFVLLFFLHFLIEIIFCLAKNQTRVFLHDI